MRSLVKYRPLGTTSLVDDFDRIFSNFFTDDYGVSTVIPQVDISESEDNYLLEADLPGLSEKDIDVKVENDLLTVSSNVEKEEKRKEKGFLVRERSSRSFCRSFVLPKDVDRDGIVAKFNNGVLQLSMPKAEAAKPKQISVK